MLMEWTTRHPAIGELLAALLRESSPIYVVGGVVRDMLMNRQPELNDLDIVIEGTALSQSKRIADKLGWAYYPLDEVRDIARIVFTAPGQPLICDVAGLRGAHIEGDLLGRDFTVNAMALAIYADGSNELIDVTGGRIDLDNLVLRRVSAWGLAEDAVRLLRAVRLIAQFGFTLEEETRRQINRLARTIRLCSPERVRDELWKMLATKYPAQALSELVDLGLLDHVLPELADTMGVEQSFPHYQNVFEHTMRTTEECRFLRDWILGRSVSASSQSWEILEGMLEPWRFQLRRLFSEDLAVGHRRGEWLVWFGMLHDIGKPAARTLDPESTPTDRGSVGLKTRRYRFLHHESVGADLAEQRLAALRFSRQETLLARAVVFGHMRPHLLHASFEGTHVSRRACHRFFRDVGSNRAPNLAGVDTLMLALADYQARYSESPPPHWQAYLEHAVQLLAFAFETDTSTGQKAAPLLDGHGLMQNLNLQPGPLIGQVLEYLLEAQVAGEVESAEEALMLASQWLDEQGH